MKWLKKYMPGIHSFIVNWFAALNNKKEGYSLKKLLAIGFFWLVAVCVYEFTNFDNVVAVLTILTSMITALIITNSISTHSANKLDKLDNPDEPKQEEK